MKKTSGRLIVAFIVLAISFCNIAPICNIDIIGNSYGATISVPKVSNLKVLSNTSSSIGLQWDKVSYSSGYQIYRASSYNGIYTKIKTITNNSTVKYTDTGLTSAKTYYYKVRAYKTLNGKNYYGAYSNILKASTKSTVQTPTSTLKISDANYPTVLSLGQYFDLKGMITSNKNLTVISVEVFNSNNQRMEVASKTVDISGQNRQQFSIVELDIYIKFNELSPGTYTYKITASDLVTKNKVLLNKQFKVEGAQYVSPVNSRVKTSGFAPNRSDWGNGYSHMACDYVSSVNDDIIRAFYGGTVYAIGYYDGTGNYILIQHNINGKTVYSRYQHLARQDVYIGQVVSAGQQIGIMGDTGIGSGKHLHFGISTRNNMGDPLNITSVPAGEYNVDSFSWDGITYYNPEAVLNKGLSVIR